MTPRYRCAAALRMRSSSGCSSSRHGLTNGTMWLPPSNSPATAELSAPTRAGSCTQLQALAGLAASDRDQAPAGCNYMQDAHAGPVATVCRAKAEQDKHLRSAVDCSSSEANQS